MNTTSLFSESKITQYGGHPVMSNVYKPGKYKYITVDTRFQDNYYTYDSSSVAHFTMSLPERVNDVRSIMVCNVEVPMSFYNFSDEIGNTYFKLTYYDSNVMPSATTTEYLIKIGSGNYTASQLVAAIQSKVEAVLGLGKLTFDLLDNYMTIQILTSGDTATVDFAVNMDGSLDKYQFKRKLGWFLGFRNISYNLDNTSTIRSENFIDVTGIRYAYLVLDEFGKGVQNSFKGFMPSSLVNKNIIAKITFNRATFPYGTILPANNFNGYLLTDRRGYNGKINLQKIQVQLVDEFGNPMNLNGLDLSFCIEAEYE